MKKKLLIITGTMGLLLFSGCTNTESEIATMRGGKIGVDDFYQHAFVDTTLGNPLSVSKKQINEQLLQEMIIKRVFLEKYGDKVSSLMIEEAYSDQEDRYGGKETFSHALQTSGLTKSDFKKMIKENLSVEVGLKEHIEIGASELDEAWEKFHPSVDTQLIQVSEETKAKEIVEKLQNDSSNFEDIAKEQSEHATTTEKGGNISFDSLSDAVPSEVKNAAFLLKDGEISDIITVIDSSTNQTSYYIVKMITNEGKGHDKEAYSKELTEIAQQTLLGDPEFVSSVIGKELEEAAIEIKDDRLKDLLSDYMAEDDQHEPDEKTTESS